LWGADVQLRAPSSELELLSVLPCFHNSQGYDDTLIFYGFGAPVTFSLAGFIPLSFLPFAIMANEGAQMVFGTNGNIKQILDGSILERFADLDQGGKIAAEYVWLGGTMSDLRSCFETWSSFVHFRCACVFDLIWDSASFFDCACLIPQPSGQTLERLDFDCPS